MGMFLVERGGFASKGYRNHGHGSVQNILVHHARPSLTCLGTTILQHDNDPKHTAKKNLNYLNGSRWPAALMEWPPQSPDLNPIENLWYYLDVQGRKRSQKPRNEAELMVALKEEWKNVDRNT